MRICSGEYHFPEEFPAFLFVFSRSSHLVNERKGRDEMQQGQRRLRQVVILTAIPAEYQAVRRHLRNPREVVHKGTVYEQGVFVAEDGKCEVGIAQIRTGNARAAAEAE